MWEGMVTEAACGEQHFLMAGDHPRYSTRVLVLHPYSSPTGKCFFSPISDKEIEFKLLAQTSW